MKINVLILSLFFSAYIGAYTDSYSKGTSYSRQIEFEHPKEGKISAAINSVNHLLDGLDKNLKYWQLKTFSFISIDRSFNAKLLPNGNFLVKNNRAAVDGQEKPVMQLSFYFSYVAHRPRNLQKNRSLLTSNWLMEVASR